MEETKQALPVGKAHIHESNLIEGFDDPAIDKASRELYRKVKARLKNVSMSHDMIEWMNKEITAHQPELDGMWRGSYRSRSRVRVWVGNREGMDPSRIGRAMDEWLEGYYTADPIEHHVAFERIHPFIDGNGRTGRMLMWLMQQDRGQKPTLIYKSRVQDYYEWFK